MLFLREIYVLLSLKKICSSVLLSLKKYVLLSLKKYMFFCYSVFEKSICSSVLLS